MLQPIVGTTSEKMTSTGATHAGMAEATVRYTMRRTFVDGDA